MSDFKRALICGISGQDGTYLAKMLLDKGYKVYGTSRENKLNSFSNLEHIGVINEIEFHSMLLNDFRSTLLTIDKIKPDEIYNLAGQSSVALSFQQPVETLESISTGTLNLLEVIRFINKQIKFYNASSSECFGKLDKNISSANENTPFRPHNPYGIAKATAFWKLAMYRNVYGVFACSGILFNHESPYRGETFVTRKITKAVAAIKVGLQDVLYLGNIDVKRDWGFAGDYVEAMWMMLQYDKPDDYIISTGEIHSVREFVEKSFAKLDMKIEWKGQGVDEVGIDSASGKTVVKIDPKYFRPAEVDLLLGDSTKIRSTLGWKPKTDFNQLVDMMVEKDFKALSEKNKIN